MTSLKAHLFTLLLILIGGLWVDLPLYCISIGKENVAISVGLAPIVLGVLVGTYLTIYYGFKDLDNDEF